MSNCRFVSAGPFIRSASFAAAEGCTHKLEGTTANAQITVLYDAFGKISGMQKDW